MQPADRSGAERGCKYLPGYFPVPPLQHSRQSHQAQVKYESTRKKKIGMELILFLLFSCGKLDIPTKQSHHKDMRQRKAGSHDGIFVWPLHRSSLASPHSTKLVFLFTQNSGLCVEFDLAALPQ